MATVRFKWVRAWISACALAAAVSAYAGESAKPVAKPSDKGVAVPGSAGKTQAVRAQSAPKTGAGRMQVEEPKASAPVSDAHASKAWQKTHAKGLTDEQKQAFRDRKEGMETMILVIKAKRKALHEAKPEDRAALARELHNLILEKDAVDITTTARVEGPEAKDSKETKAAISQSDAASKAEARALRREEYRKQLEKVNKAEKGKQRKSKQEASD